LLVQKGGKARYLKFLADAHNMGSWERAIAANYDYRGIDDLEKDWQNWIVAGCPDLKLPDGQLLADRGEQNHPAGQQFVVRGQTPADDPFLDNAPSQTRLAGRQEVGDTEHSVPARPLPLAQKTGSRTDRPDEREAALEPCDRVKARAPAAPRHPATRSDPFTNDEIPPIAKAPGALPSALRARQSRTRPAEAGSDGAQRRTVPCSEFPFDPRPSPLTRTGKRR
jgi:hypothetical protein